MIFNFLKNKRSIEKYSVWENKNPFKEDVIILDFKEGYILYYYLSAYYKHRGEEWFNDMLCFSLKENIFRDYYKFKEDLNWWFDFLDVVEYEIKSQKNE